MKETKRFLIIDDDDDDCQLFCEAIREINPLFECYISMNSSDALMKLKDGSIPIPDFIFLDLNMPKTNGKACLIELKKDQHLKHIPVIMLTTSSSQHDIDETNQLGASFFITKPSNFNSLCKKIVFIIEENWNL